MKRRVIIGLFVYVAVAYAVLYTATLVLLPHFPNKRAFPIGPIMVAVALKGVRDEARRQARISREQLRGTVGELMRAQEDGETQEVIVDGFHEFLDGVTAEDFVSFDKPRK